MATATSETNEPQNATESGGGTTLTQQVDEAMPVEGVCDELRVRIKNIGERVLALKKAGGFQEEEAYPGQHGEMKANIMLTYRHLEDARMRVGKILQAAGDGVSILDK